MTDSLHFITMLHCTYPQDPIQTQHWNRQFAFEYILWFIYYLKQLKSIYFSTKKETGVLEGNCDTESCFTLVTVKMITVRIWGFYLFNVHVIKMVLYKLDGGIEVGLVELVRDVPSQRPVLSPLLYCAVEKCHSVQHRLPLHHVTDIQKVLANTWAEVNGWAAPFNRSKISRSIFWLYQFLKSACGAVIISLPVWATEGVLKG